jgi:UDP-N-acetylglucosamine--N-acetylmuramyl-(pentapeptide) pyrophosphoryl-undecaprenol N-acetylglucosamine transferase
MRILVTTGASGGHILPALSFINVLKNKRQGVDVLLVIPKRSLKYNLSLGDIKVKYVSFLPIKLSLEFKNFIALIKLFQGALESLMLLLEFKPDIVVGFGTLDTVALVIFAWMARIKTLIHEQNVTPGRANRLLAKFSDRIAVSFEETKEYLKDYRKKVVLTGNPLRENLVPVEKERALSYLGLSRDKFTVLVMGGSLGSHSINVAFLKSISQLADKSKIQVFHITGDSDHVFVNNRYKDLNLDAKTFSFFSEMQFAYSACDLLVSRSGAAVVAEIIFFKLPAILVPYPYAYAHQLNNAKLLEKQGCACLIRDKDLDSTILKETIELFLNNPHKLADMRSSYETLKLYNASDLLANEAVSLNYN